MKKIILLFIGFLIIIDIAKSQDDKLLYEKACNEKDDYKAIGLFTTCISTFATNSGELRSSYFNRGSRKWNVDDYYGAIADLKKALTINVTTSKIYWMKYKEGFVSNEDEMIYFGLGCIYGQINDYNNSIVYLTKAIEININDAAAYYFRGLTKANLDDTRGAIADYNKAININPNYTEAYSKRGVSKVSLNDYYGAIADCNKAIDLDSKYPEAYFGRGLAKIALNRKEDGCLDLSKAGELGYEKAYETIKSLCQ